MNSTLHTDAPCATDMRNKPPAPVSPREIAVKLFFRFRLFLICTIAVTLTTLVLTILIPPTYTVTAKLLIKYETENPFFGEIATQKLQIVSGRSNAEIIRSIDLCRSVVESLQLGRADIDRPAYKRLVEYLLLPFTLFSSSDSKQKTAVLADNLKQSIETKTIQKDRTELVVSDELIEVTVPSPNRSKVATIANTLCKKFIDEYYKNSEAEAQRAYEYLTDQAMKAESDLDSLQTGAAGTAAATAVPGFSFNEAGDKNISANPLVENLSNQVARLQVELGRLRHVYTENSPEVQRARDELDRARVLLQKNESQETAKSMLNIIRTKRQQAFMTLQLYKHRLIPISIVEEALPPTSSGTAILIRFLVNTLLGLAGGMTLGIALVILFTALDHRIYASWELEKELGLNVLCSIPAIEKQGPLFSSLTELPLPEATSGLIQVLGKLDLIGRDMGRVMLVTSPTSGEGKTTLALQLACALSRDKRTNVLLIDAALKSGGLSSLIPHEGVEGMVDVLKNERTIAEVLRPTAIKNLAFVPTGTIGNRLELGFFKKTLHEAIAAIRPGYDVIIIDAAGLLVSPEAPLLASEADAVLMTIKAGATHKEPLRNALELLGQLGICSCDAVLNFRRFPIPPAFYRSI